MMSFLKRYSPLLACLGGLLLGYDTGMIGSALLFIQPLFHLTPSFQGLIASIIIPNIMLGILIISLFADRWDRRTCITFAAVIYLLGFSIATFATHIFMLILGRILAGFSIGIVLVIVPLYLAEVAPAAWRGRFIAVFQLAITLGVFLGYLFSYWLAHYAAWRLMFACGLIWAFLLLMGSFYLPPSPYSSQKIRQETTGFKLKKIFYREFRYPFMIGIGIALLQQFTGINAIMYFAPQILHTVQHQSDTAAIFSALIIACGNFLFTIIALLVLDSIGRRPVLIFSLFVQFVSLAMLGAISHGLFHGNSIVFIICLLFFILGYAVGLGPAGWLIVSEIYPFSIRSKAMGITIMINNIAAFIVAVSFLPLLHTLDKSTLFWLFSFISLLGLFFVWIAVPETKQKSLEEIQDFFNEKSA